MVFTNFPPRDLEKEAKGRRKKQKKIPRADGAGDRKIHYSKEVLTKQYFSVK